ncbi:MAG: trypsin-like peptidase domain-containing protein [Spirochaetes bacterium]|nr:trypsin-like peptidase domain-containing protein [Spirochaetota bacterium]MBU0955762.1 trypsin-like peptidase domain-containing protein [Spirochaetota bacterium]
MRLYSRSQLLVVALCSVIVGLLLAIGFGVLPLKAGVNDVDPVQLAADDKPVVDALNPAYYNSSGAGASSAAEATLQTVDSVAGYSLDERENIDVYERLNTGVVNITTEVVALNWFMEPIPREGGSGSGSIIDERGYVLTNYHVVKQAVKVWVSLADGARYEGTVVGYDAENDLAVVKFEPPRGLRLTVIPFGSSDGLKVGQKVLAIGNPFGLDRTLTTGVVSSIKRAIQQDNNLVIHGMIQTDASINPGNSGGPLLNSRGEMIGINTVIYSTSGGSVGVGFAVPVDTAKRVVPDLLRYGMVKRGWIEAELVQLVPAIVDYMEERDTPLPVEKGLLVSIATRSGNAERAGLRGGTIAVRYMQSLFNVGGDIIVSVDGMEVATISDLYAALEDNKPGDKVMVEYYRNGRKASLEVTLADRAQAVNSRK